MFYETLRKTLVDMLSDGTIQYDAYYGLDIEERLEREIKDIEKHGLQEDIDKLLIESQITQDNPASSLVLWLAGLCETFPVGEFTPVCDIFTDRLNPIDIDIDVSAVKRQDVISFVQTRMQAFPIIAFNTLNTKSAIKELGRALGFPFSMMNSITQSIDAGIETKLTEAVKNRYPRFFEEVAGLEGVINHISTHASGIAVFNGKPEDHFISLRKAPKETYPIVDLDGDALGKLGVMKVDLLGSATTDVIAEVEELSGVKLPPDDEIVCDLAVIDAFSKCNVSGIFQAGGDTNKAVFSAIKPVTFQEVADCISLARPGTKEQIPAYCKYQPEITNELVYSILQETRGILLYQEQVLEIVKTLGDVDGTEAEQLRGAIAKKKNLDTVQHIQDKFLNNARKKIGDDADKLWEVISKHVTYSFNKSHAVAYSLQAFRQMWQKINHPTEFWCAMLNACNEKEKYEYRYEIAREGIELLVPNCYNVCSRATVPSFGYIQLPVTMIKGIGDNSAIDGERLRACDNIHSAIRVLSNLNKKSLLLLAEANFFSPLCSIYEAVSAINQQGQISLFDDNPIPNVTVGSEFQREMENYGFWVTSHPMQNLDSIQKIIDVVLYGGNEIYGRVDEVKILKDKHGQDMAFITVGDDTYYMKCAVFSKQFPNLEFTPFEGDMVRVVGNLRNGTFTVNNIERI